VLGKWALQASQLLEENLAISGKSHLETSPAWWLMIPHNRIHIEVFSSIAFQAEPANSSDVME
jgi:hypothetical protein